MALQARLRKFGVIKETNIGKINKFAGLLLHLFVKYDILFLSKAARNILEIPICFLCGTAKIQGKNTGRKIWQPFPIWRTIISRN
jgi:hypothetical protein